jgi:hypothetical protein
MQRIPNASKFCCEYSVLGIVFTSRRIELRAEVDDSKLIRVPIHFMPYPVFEARCGTAADPVARSPKADTFSIR